MDIYLVSIVLPALAANVSLYALSLSLVPVFRETMARASTGSAWALARRMLLRVTPAILLLGVAIALAAEPIIRVLAPGFDPGSVRTASILLRLMSAAVLLDIGRALVSSIYYALDRFFLPQIAPVLNHATMIVAALVLYRRIGLLGLAAGWVIGSALMILVLVLGLGRESRGALDGEEAQFDLGRIGAQIWPSLSLVLAAQAIPVVDRAVATTLPSGSVSYLGYGYKILELMLRTAPMAVVLAAFPRMSGQASIGDWEKLQAEVSSGLKWIILGSVPVALLVYQLRTPLIRVLFERGAFDHAATEGVAAATAWYAIALLPASVAYLFNHVYFAIRRAKVLTFLALGSIIVTALLDLSLSRLWGFEGIAIAHLFVISFLASALFVLLRVPQSQARLYPGGKWLARILAAALVMSLLVRTTSLAASSLDLGVYGRQLSLALSASIGTIAYFGTLRIVRLPELARIDLKTLWRSPTSWPPDEA
jgi:putative peptidoglycan lipid II flippase